MSRSRNSRKGSKHQGCPEGRKCDYCASNRQFNTKKRKAQADHVPLEGRIIGGCFETDDTRNWSTGREEDYRRFQ